jgi:hypothetical protein
MIFLSACAQGVRLILNKSSPHLFSAPHLNTCKYGKEDTLRGGEFFFLGTRYSFLFFVNYTLHTTKCNYTNRKGQYHKFFILLLWVLPAVLMIHIHRSTPTLLHTTPPKGILIVVRVRKMKRFVAVHRMTLLGLMPF